ncbi:MAG: sulfite exporter TauE/SafE family protein [Agarilytica sp.]
MVLIVGLVIGIVLGMTGAGGSVFAVPLLVNLLDLPMQQAIGLSLGAVAVSAAFGVLLKLRSGHIEWLPAGVFATLGSLGAPLGNWINRQFDEQILLVGFAVLVVIVALRMWKQASQNPEQAAVVRAGSNKDDEENGAVCVMNEGKKFQIGLPCVMGMSAGAIATGILSGLFGVGGGFLIVPILLALTKITIQQAVATSLVVIAVISSVGFGSFIMYGNAVSTNVLSFLALGGIAGMAVGIFASKYIAGPVLQKIFSVLMIVILIVTLVINL